jgi:hypothetical protein
MYIDKIGRWETYGREEQDFFGHCSDSDSDAFRAYTPETRP